MEASVDSLRQHVQNLTSAQMNGREFGTDGDRLASAYVQERFAEYGLIAPEQYPNYLQPLPGGGQNVLGILRDSDPELSRECVIIDAHQDHMGEGFPGASDNAAGVAVMLELARILSSRKNLSRSILFACLDGEEPVLMVKKRKQLMQGATYYVQNPVFELKRTAALITLDTLGRSFLSSDLLFVLGLERSLMLQEVVGGCTTDLMKVRFRTDLLTGVMGNYIPFVEKKIPAIFISNGIHPDYHGRDDTPEKLSYGLLEKDLHFVIELVERVAGSAKTDFCRSPIPPKEEQEDILYLLTLLKDAMGRVNPADAGKFDLIIEKMQGTPSAKEMKQAIQILLGFAAPNFAKLYILLHEAQTVEKKDPSSALKHYREILGLYDEYRVPYLWIQEMREKVANLEKRLK